MAQFQVYQSQSAISQHVDVQQQHAQAQQSAVIQDIQQKIDTVVPQLGLTLTALTDEKFLQFQRDQANLLTGVLGALVDIKLQTDAHIATLRTDVQTLHDANILRDMAFVQLQTMGEDVTLQHSHIHALTVQLTGMHQQIAEVRQQLADTQHQLTMVHRDSAASTQQLSDHLRATSGVPGLAHSSPLPVLATAPHHWRWLALLLLVSGSVATLIWLGYVPEMK